MHFVIDIYYNIWYTYDTILAFGKGGSAAMRIGGMQKPTPLDYPGKVALLYGILSAAICAAHTAITPTWCFPERSGKGGNPEAEVLAYLERRRGSPDAPRHRVGEPTLQSELPEF